MIARLHTKACDLLGCTHPVVLAGMGGVARSELVAAVTEAGGFGFLGMVREAPSLIQREVEAVRRRTAKPFGVNLIPAATDPDLLERQLATCRDLKVPVVALFWDVAEAIVRPLCDAGIRVVYQVGSAKEAEAAQRAGAHMLIAQGVEAGGHVRGTTPLWTLLREVVASSSVPVLAAGGLVDGHDLATALRAGAQGVVIGTAFLASPESFAHEYHKQRIVQAQPDDTVLTDIFHINWPVGAPVRVLRNSTVRGEKGDPFGPARIIGAEDERPIFLFSTDSPLRAMTGDFEAMALYAGRGVDRITASVPAAAQVAAIVREALHSLDEPQAPAGFSSPACFAHEANAAYMGYLEPDELAAAVGVLLERERAARAALANVTAGEGPGHARIDIAQVLDAAIAALESLLGKGETERVKTAAATPKATDILADQRALAAELRGLAPKIGDEAIRKILLRIAQAHEATAG